MIISKYSPIAPWQRIISIDVLRGFAVLGILIMNIQCFSMIFSAYDNPTVYGDLTGINKWVWMLSHIIADQKFMSIFSILFGAGIILMTDNLEKKGLHSTGLHYRRMMWLLIFGLLHAYLLWFGDILVSYALVGMIAYLFRKKTPKTLLIVGISLIVVPFLLSLFFNWSMSYWPEESIRDTLEKWQPDKEIIEHNILIYRGSWTDQMENRIPIALMIQTLVFFMYSLWRVCGLMLIGMALYKLKVLSASRSSKFYLWFLIIGFLVGYFLVITGMIKNFSAGWTMEYSMFGGKLFNYWGSIFVSFGYIGLVMLFCKSNLFSGFKKLLAAVGRMAFTNYILQTLICTTIFYGHGFGFYGKVERGGQILIVFGVWIFSVLLSYYWLKYFRFGPLEWLWRSLSYMKFQPIKLDRNKLNQVIG